MHYYLYNPLAGNVAYRLDQAIHREKGQYRTITLLGLDLRGFFADCHPDDVVFLLGGDGTLNRFINDCSADNLPCPVYLLRAGTGNDFLKDADSDNRSSFLLNPYLKDLPYVIVKGKAYRYINGVAVGIDGMVCEVADDLKAKGKTKINYTAIALKLLAGVYRCPDAEVTVDGVTTPLKKVWLASSMKGRYYGGGMKIAPSQDRKSGLLTFVSAHGSGRAKTLASFPKIFKGEHAKDTKMMFFAEGRDISVRFTKPTAMQIDGEVIRNVTEYRACTPDVYQLLTGKDDEVKVCR